MPYPTQQMRQQQPGHLHPMGMQQQQQFGGGPQGAGGPQMQMSQRPMGMQPQGVSIFINFLKK